MRVSLLWNAESSLGRRWFTQTKWPYTYYGLLNYIPLYCLSFLTSVLEHMKSFQNCHHLLSLSLCEHQHAVLPVTWLPVRLWACMCVKCCVPLYQHTTQIPHSKRHWDTHLFNGMCVGLRVRLCVQLEPLHVTALVPSCPFTHNDWPSWDTHTHTLPAWVTSDMGLLWHFPRTSSSVHSRTRKRCTAQTSKLSKCVSVCVCVCHRRMENERPHLSKELRCQVGMVQPWEAEKRWDEFLHVCSWSCVSLHLHSSLPSSASDCVCV